ncbi:acyl-CoA thioesterase [Thermomonospora umbrina]|uniref:Acyl-CoA thioesterase n=1 Tax=Thermomonospora umbrina TaxID=111806 RepID=A0A3D9SMY0_9ACTN|nr:thioesterase family protein [Thermomonospora umbrina]REE97286.1 acyl-CoA thioesterase [Thermomonospora umbrina]
MSPITTFSHRFDDATGLTPLGDGVFEGRTDPAYTNMVGPFGGLTAAILLQAVLLDERHLGEPVSLTVNYAGPIADGPFTISVDPVRTNRNTQHWTVTLSQNDVVATTATAVFGTRRATWASTESAPPEAPPASAVEPAEFPELVAWLDNYEMRFVEGSSLELDAGPRPSSTSTLWVRDKPARPLDHLSLTAMSDVFLPRVMLRLGKFVPAGTVTLTVYFHADTDVLAAQGDRPVLATARAGRLGRGFSDQYAELWTDDGELLATGHQLVYFKA